MLQNARVTAFTVSELLRENQQGVKLPPPPPPTHTHKQTHTHTHTKTHIHVRVKVIGKPTFTRKKKAKNSKFCRIVALRRDAFRSLSNICNGTFCENS